MTCRGRCCLRSALLRCYKNVDYANRLLKFEQSKTKGHSGNSGVVIPLNDRRTAEYTRHIGESRIYVVPELSTDNEQWINPDFGTPELRTHYDNIKQMVKEKIGRAM